MKSIQSAIGKYAIYLAFLQAWAATLGSLYFSEIAKFPPCVLCWYQRICMYPLVAILTVGLLRRDKKVYLYVFPLSIAGMLVAVYQNLLYYSIIPESIKPCTAGVSCTTKFISWFGFVTIPFLSLGAFVIINLLMLIIYLNNKNEQRK